MKEGEYARERRTVSTCLIRADVVNFSPAYVVCAQQLTLLARFFCGCEGHKCVVVCCSAARNLTLAIPGDKIYLEKKSKYGVSFHTHS